MSSTVLSVIQHYQRSIEHSQDDEGRLLHCINKLYRLPVKVEHLQETGVGKTVNSLRKYNGEIGVAAKALVTKWKAMVAAEEEPVETHNSQNDHNGNSDDDASNGNNGQNSSDDDHHNTNSYNSQNNQNKNTNKEHTNTNPTTRENKPKDRQSDHHHHQSNKEHKSKTHREDKPSKNTHDHSSSSKHKRRTELDQNGISMEKRIKHDEPDDGDGESKKRENHRHKSSHEKMEKLKTSSKDVNSTPSHSSHNRNCDAGDSNGKKEIRHKDEKRSEQHASSSRHQTDHNSESISKHADSEKNNSPKDKDRRERSKESKHEKSKSSSKESSHRDKHHKSASSNSKPSSSSSSKTADQPSTSTSSTKPDSASNGSSSSSSKRKRHHDSDSNDASPSKTKDAKKAKSPKTKTATNDNESEIDVNDGIDSSMGANFEDVLGMLNMPTKKSKKSLSNNKSPTLNTPKKNASTEKASGSTSSSSSIKDNKNEYKPSSTTASSSKPIDMKPELLTSAAKLAPLDPSIALELPTISTNYKPLPTNKIVMECVYRNSGIVNNTPKPPVRTLTDAEAISHGISSKTMRTKIYSGIKTGQMFQVPSLFDLCIRILQKNIDALEYTGGVPFEVLRPVLERATPTQLLTFEEYNPYLMEDSDCLWQIHVQRSFRTKKREEMESWREMFLRCEDEKERKLSSLTETIKKSQKIITAPVRKTQLAFVDSMVKPPRNVLRKQEQFGTREKVVATPAARVAALSNVTPNVAKVGDTRLRVAATVRDTAQATAPPARSKKAPLMAKTLQFIRGRHKR